MGLSYAKNEYNLFYHKLDAKYFHVKQFFHKKQFFFEKTAKTVLGGVLHNFFFRERRRLKPGPHLYANANEALVTEANPNECPICAKCGLFCVRQVKHMPTIVNLFSLKCRLQMDSVRLFTECSPPK